MDTANTIAYDDNDGSHSFLLVLDHDHGDDTLDPNKTGDETALSSMDEVPYLMDSDAYLGLPSAQSARHPSSHYQHDEEDQSAAISLHSYSQTLPSMASVYLHSYSQPASQAGPTSGLDAVHNYSQPWPQNATSFTSVHNYCISEGVKDASLVPGGTQEQLIQVKQSESHEPLCLKIQYTDTYICHWNNCGESFEQGQDLVLHVSKHLASEGVAQWVCCWNACPRHGKPFDARYRLVHHMRIHTLERPHKCSLCEREFSSAEGLTKHQRIHTGEKPYACKFPGCKRAFTNSGDRFKHTLAHKVKWPYPCEFPGCTKKYTDPGSLRKHVRLHGHRAGNRSTSNAPSVQHTIQAATLLSRSGTETSVDVSEVEVADLVNLTPRAAINGGSTSNPFLSSALMLPLVTSGKLFALHVKDGLTMQDTPLDLSTGTDDCVLYEKWTELND